MFTFPRGRTAPPAQFTAYARSASILNAVRLESKRRRRDRRRRQQRFSTADRSECREISSGQQPEEANAHDFALASADLDGAANSREHSRPPPRSARAVSEHDDAPRHNLAGVKNRRLDPKVVKHEARRAQSAKRGRGESIIDRALAVREAYCATPGTSDWLSPHPLRQNRIPVIGPFRQATTVLVRGVWRVLQLLSRAMTHAPIDRRIVIENARRGRTR